ncbi:quinate 5-dehydrogenase [Limnochorda pilosa]|uniref:Quinate 5-dehydrogenase n=1 Tax=Limnochorda pilosa TaxID=1555112 RepID=A0A0K2SKR4_LIMPI|nr:quinate 5-dehydrogenase [Limnochorda pilosa]BAS27612.1 hypothetical protein LIP_1768 [Limnochorda pilosa]
MKRIVSVSLGSSSRNSRATFQAAGEEVTVERIGTDGDRARAVALIRDLDGTVDAFGMGGIDLYLVAGERRYMIREARPLLEAARRTPIVDGSGLKNTLERRVVERLAARGVLPLRGRRVLLVSGVDRFGMAEALEAAGSETIYGDLIFALGVPIPIRSLRGLRILARILLPVLTQLPFQMLYPTGGKQEKITPRHARIFRWADVIAGDFHFIRRYMPDALSGKVILTNTVTSQNVEELRQRGVRTLVTTTPNLQGRSFGTNVMEALIVALAGKRWEEMTPADYLQWLDRLGFEPRVEGLDGTAPQPGEAGSPETLAPAN